MGSICTSKGVLIRAFGGDVATFSVGLTFMVEAAGDTFGLAITASRRVAKAHYGIRYILNVSIRTLTP